MNQYQTKCGRCGGGVEPQHFHGVVLHRCLACGNIMIAAEDLEQLIARNIPLPQIPQSFGRTIVPDKAPPPQQSKAAETSAGRGMLSLASETILPIHTSSTTPPPPRRRARSFVSSAQPTPKAPPPPPPRPTATANEPSLGFGWDAVEQERNEPALDLPSIPSQREKSPFLTTEDDTEEIERHFFSEEETDFSTEDTEHWTEEDELALERFASGQKRKGVGLVFGGLLILLGLLVLPAGLLVLLYFPGEAPATLDPDIPTDTTGKEIPELDTPDAVEPVDPIEADGATPPTDTPDAPVEPEPTAPSDDEETLAKAEEPKPKTTAVIAPKPKPKPKPRASSRKQHIKDGWGLVEANPGRAAKSFRQALDLNQGDFEANYGYGYAMLKQGDPEEARRYLCMASGSDNPETQREVLAVLNGNGMACN